MAAKTYFKVGGIKTPVVLFEPGTVDPSELGAIRYVTGVGFRAYGNGGVFTIPTASGSGTPGSMEDSYSLGRTVTVDEGAIVFTDTTAAALNTMEFVKSGAGSGNVLNIAMNAAATGSALAMDMNLALAAYGVYLDAGAGARTGSDFYVKDDSTGAHSVLDIAKSGSGASIGFKYQESYNGSSTSFGAQFTLDNTDGIDTTAIQIVRGTGLRTVPAIDINDASTGSGDLIDIDLTGVFTGDVFDFASAGAATGNVINILLDNALAMTAVRVAGAGVRTQPYLELIATQTGSADMIDISCDGAFTGDALAIDMNAAVGANALFLDAGNALRTAPMVLVTFDGTGNTVGATLFDINVTNASAAGSPLFDIDVSSVYTGNIIDITFSAAAATGDAISIAMATNLAGAALIITGAGARSDDLIQIDDSSTGSANVIDINISGVYTGNVLDITYSAAATGDAISVAMVTNVAGSAMVVTTAGARTDDLFKIDDGSTGNSHIFDINLTAVYTGNVLDITYSAAATGDAISIVMATNVAGSALLITGAGARTDDLIKIDDASTGNSQIFDINLTGVYTGNVLDIAFSVGAATGDAILITMGTAIAGTAINVVGTGARSDDLFQVDTDATGAGLIWDVNITGAASGNCFDVTYSVGANTGNAISLAMGTNVAGQAIVITSAATGVSGEGSALDIAHTGNLAAGADLIHIVSTGNHDASSDVVYLEQSTGACTAGTNLLHLKATGTNCEALYIEAGLLFQSVATATPGSGNDETLPCTSNVVHYDPNGGSRTGVIVANGLRDGQKLTILNIADAAETVTMAASATSHVANGVACIITRYMSVELTWNAATGLWYQNIVA